MDKQYLDTPFFGVGQFTDWLRQQGYSLDTTFCLLALEGACSRLKPQIINTDQGAQYTSTVFSKRVVSAGIQLSMDGKGRAIDNVFTERFWRSLKYEEV